MSAASATPSPLAGHPMTMMRFFGPPWEPIAEVAEECACPVGTRCAFCGVTFELGEQGVVMPRVVSNPDGTVTMGQVGYHRRCAGLEFS